MTSAHRLSTELLVEIFRFCCLAPPDRKEWPHPKITDGPALVSHVCRSWRSIILSLPALWSFIGISIQDDYDLQRGAANDGKLLARVQLWLSRSENHPLSLSLVSERISRNFLNSEEEIEKGIERLNEKANRFLEIFMDHIGRWWSFRLTNVEVSEHFPRTIPIGGAPLLEELQVDDGDTYSSAIDKIKLPRLLESPHLKHLLWSVDYSYGVPPWSRMNLQSLRLNSSSGLNRQVYLEILPLNLQLRHLFVEDMETDVVDELLEMNGSLPKPFVLPNLETLCVRRTSTPLLAFLTLPALRKLTLEGQWTRTDSADPNVVLPFLIRSQCPLTTLSYSGYPAIDLITKYLEQVSDTLLELECDDENTLKVSSWEELAAQLTILDNTRTAEHLCPKLERVKFSPSWGVPTEEWIWMLLLSRRGTLCFGKYPNITRVPSHFIARLKPLSQKEAEAMVGN